MVKSIRITKTRPKGTMKELSGAVVAAQILDSFEGSDPQSTVPRQHVKADN